MRGIELAGFWIEGSTQRSILIVFIIYSLIIVGMGFYVKYQSKFNQNNNFASFLTGGGGLNGFEIGMISATTAMAGGTMVSGPGYTYQVGFIYSIVCFTLFIQNFVVYGTYGKKFAIMKNRLNATTSVQLIHHRFQSKAVAIVLSLCGVIFLTVIAGGQFLAAAKVFGAVMGETGYQIGLLVSALVILIYSLAGGYKSMAKIAVIQGVFMIVSVIMLTYGVYNAVIQNHGSMQNAMEFVNRTNPDLLDIRIFPPLHALGLILVTGWGNIGSPSIMQSAMLHNDTKSMIRASILGGFILLLINLIMASTGPITYSLNQNITNADYQFLYLSTKYLPNWMSGVIISGVFAAIQSSVASMLIISSGLIVQDLYKDCFNPNIEDRQLRRINLAVLIIVAVAALAIAWNPTQLAQKILILGTGGFAVTYIIPFIFGLFWKKATATGALLSSLGGFTVYIVIYLISLTGTEEFANIHPIIPGIITGFVFMILGSRLTQHKKVPLGIFKVWFCKDYDETFSKIYNACELSENQFK